MIEPSLAAALAAAYVALRVLVAPALPASLAEPLLTSALWAGGLGFCAGARLPARATRHAPAATAVLAGLAPQLFLHLAGSLRRPGGLALLAASALAALFFAAGAWLGVSLARWATPSRLAASALAAALGATAARVAFAQVEPLWVLQIALGALALAPLLLTRAPATVLAAALGIGLLAASTLAPWAPPPSAMPGGVERLQQWARRTGGRIERRFVAWDGGGLTELWAVREAGAAAPHPIGVLAHNGVALSPVLLGSDPEAALEACEASLHGFARVEPGGRVAVLGPQALDIACALARSARVDVFEARPALRRALRAHVRGGPPRLRYHALSPRAGARAEGAYDLVVWSPARMLPVVAAPLSAPIEAPLWTREGMRAWLGRLTQEGALAITAFGQPEALRALHTAAAALHDAGARAPERHLAVAQSGGAYGILVRRKPWAMDAALALHARYRDIPSRPPTTPFDGALDWSLGPPPALRFDAHGAFDNPFGRLLSHVARGDAHHFVERYAFDITPATDARPHFAQQTRLDRRDLWQTTAAPLVLGRHALLLGALSLFVLGGLTLCMRGAHARLLGAALACAGYAAVIGFALSLHALALRLDTPAQAFNAATLGAGALAALLLTLGADGVAQRAAFLVAGASAAGATTGALALFLGYAHLGLCAAAVAAAALVFTLAAVRNSR